MAFQTYFKLKFSWSKVSVLILLSIVSQCVFAALVPTPPNVSASSYILMDAKSGMTIIEQNADEVIPPASLTKIMTSYITEYEIEQGNISPDDLVPISIKAWKKGGSRMYVQEGTKVKLIDLLRGIIIQSGNDASIAVAEFIAGSEESFADLMNQHAQRLGMKNSHFVNATGWPDVNHYSTAKDLAILSKALIEDFPQHYGIYSERSFAYNNIQQPNRNSLLGWNDLVDGIKTGYTREAGYCLVASGEDDKGMRLISVVTGTSSTKARAQESQKLLTYGFRFFRSVEMANPNQPLKTVPIWKGQEPAVTLGVHQPVRVTVPRSQVDSLQLNLDTPLYAIGPIDKNQSLGSLKVTLDDTTLVHQDLVAQSSIARSGFLKSIWHSIVLFFKGLFG